MVEDSLAAALNLRSMRAKDVTATSLSIRSGAVRNACDALRHE